MTEKTIEPRARKKPRFLRRDWTRYSKLGKGRKNKQKWKKPVGRDNKMREKRTGYPATVSIGYRTDKSLRGKIEAMKVVEVKNIKDLAGVGKNEMVVLGKMGKKKKLEIAKKAQETGIKIQNLNAKKFVKKNEKSEKVKGKTGENKK